MVVAGDSGDDGTVAAMEEEDTGSDVEEAETRTAIAIRERDLMYTTFLLLMLLF